MDIILQKFAGKIDAKSLIMAVEEIKVEYLDDGFTKEDVPPILGRLMMETNKFKKLPLRPREVNINLIIKLERDY